MIYKINDLFYFFRFFTIFLPQTVFIGRWDIKFNFLDFFPQTVKNDQICIQTIKFVFKRLHLNLNIPIRKRHLTTAHRLQRWAVPLER
jgi:hypothetical protein